ncbi:SusD/RagB family nutrient-binding outer membrane lipoprotein [Sphingobacterium sp. E70]|uniref:SusD/RagB family nutrient-binding outer membrane lipoprotein n=1 Tax=Sphingobacterium sp. E70 TaxID=2853439 RepID=UPI00211D0FB5|nr:SusD/RagB family nutrient-binding outer membrane lipoprotein [Sphingobacterium sp. E70]
MNTTKDPRIASIARKNNAGKYVGFINGSENNPNPFTSISWIGEHYVNDPRELHHFIEPVKLITCWQKQLYLDITWEYQQKMPTKKR